MAELRAHQKRWDAADRMLGYSVALHPEALSAEHEERLANALWSVSASSLIGVIVKLDAMICVGECSEDCQEIPWPQLRSLQCELVRIARIEKT